MKRDIYNTNTIKQEAPPRRLSISMSSRSRDTTRTPLASVRKNPTKTFYKTIIDNKNMKYHMVLSLISTCLFSIESIFVNQC